MLQLTAVFLTICGGNIYFAGDDTDKCNEKFITKVLSVISVGFPYYK